MFKSTLKSLTFALLLAAGLGLQSGAAQAQKPDGCIGTLREPTTPGTALVITKTCTVPAGTYKFGNVHILKGGTLTFEDAVIDFWAANILIENEGALVAGSPEKPIGDKGTLTIHLYGADKTGNDPNKQGNGIYCLSDYDVPCGIPPAIWKSNVDDMGMPVPVAQAKKISDLPESVRKLYPGNTDDYFYAYEPLPYDGLSTATQAGYFHDKVVGFFGYKVLAVSYGGSLQLFGSKGATYAKGGCRNPPPTSSGTSWARLDFTVDANQALRQLTVDREMTLKKGDKIVLTSTDYLPGHSEELTVSADVDCGTTIGVDEAFKWGHNGSHFSLETVPARIGLDKDLQKNGAEVRAAVGVLTRSIRIVSEGDTFADCVSVPKVSDCFPAPPPEGSKDPGYYFGGHVIVRQGVETFQIQGVEFKQLGQGGRISHYPVHFHHVRRAPPDTFVRDSSINESMTRWIVLHGTQDVKLERNVGYKSIGHGFYLEDGTEINNTLTANLGIFARAAVDNVQNPRKVPGILAAPNLQDEPASEVPPYRSDYDHPTVFWIMNGWNTFTDNLAVGAGTCGVCYWLLPAVNSTMSRDMKWASYASMQSSVARAGTAPLKSFVGNSCSTAMTSFQTITVTEACQGVGPVATVDPFLPTVLPIKNELAPPSVAPKDSDKATIAKVAAAAANYYPTLGDGGHFPTKCTVVRTPGETESAFLARLANVDDADCSTVPERCSAGALDNCMVTVLDRYTTSFNWAAFNFAAIWLRPQWYLVTDSVIADVQQAGLTMVTGGGYSESDVIPGHWALVRKSVFIGNTQEGNWYASNGGPFNPLGLKCAVDKNGNRPGNYCLHVNEGVSHQMSNFGMYQRLFSVYDGPAFQDSNVYLNIKTRPLDDCVVFLDDKAHVGRCDPPDLSPGKPRQSSWLAGIVLGLPKEGHPPGGAPFCYMPNAAIGWKQPNGFFYPPAFHSLNLYFDKVDYRHFVVSPLFDEGTYNPKFKDIEDTYCVFNPALFTGFAGNDRQTVLNDDDGTLTGYKETTVINLDPFFNAPVDAVQCLSDETSRTSPYEYVTTVLYPKCAYDGTCAKPPVGKGEPGYPEPNWNNGDWNRACTSETCYGVPLWRQELMPIADKGAAQSIRMMGQETGQRSSLTVNHGTYYFDTTVDKETQLICNNAKADNPCVVNVFQANQTYYLFLIFAKAVACTQGAEPECTKEQTFANTEQTYRFWVGKEKDTGFKPDSITMVRAPIGKNPIPFTDIPTDKAKPVTRWLNDDPDTGVVEVRIVAKDYPGILADIDAAEVKKCQPATFCKWNANPAKEEGELKPPPPRCEGVDALGNFNKQTDICRWPNADLDCPENGCVGIKFTLPANFVTRKQTDPNPLPAAVCVKKAGSPFDVSLDALEVKDKSCPVPADKRPLDFCS